MDAGSPACIARALASISALGIKAYGWRQGNSALDGNIAAQVGTATALLLINLSVTKNPRFVGKAYQVQSSSMRLDSLARLDV